MAEKRERKTGFSNFSYPYLKKTPKKRRNLFHPARKISLNKEILSTHLTKATKT